MKPSPVQVAEFLARELNEYGQNIASPYIRKQLATGAMVLSMLAQDMDRAVPRRLEEVAAIRRLLHEALPFIDAAALVQEIEQIREPGAQRPACDFSLTALDLEIDQLHALLIRVHACLEHQTNLEATGMCNRIWQELVNQTERRKTSFVKL